MQLEVSARDRIRVDGSEYALSGDFIVGRSEEKGFSGVFWEAVNRQVFSGVFWDAVKREAFSGIFWEDVKRF